MLLSLASCGSTQTSAESTTLTGKANGFGGVITATVTTQGDKITSVTFDGPDETPTVGGQALETLAEAMTKAGSVDVDLVAGATVTSTTAVAAVNNALDPEAYPYEAPAEKDDTKTLEGADLYHGLGSKPHCKRLGRVLAVLFSCFCVLASFGIGNMSQVNSIAGNMQSAFGIPTVGTGVALLVLSALVILGGLKRVAAVSEKIVPFMAIAYIVGAIIIILTHITVVPAAFAAIFKGAFGLKAAGGGVLGYGINMAITWGFKRGAFSNEAGLGSSVMVHSSSNVKEPVQQGMWGIFEVFADTIVVCTLTALVLLCTGFVDLETGLMLTDVQGSALAGEAFATTFGALGPKFIAVAILLFAYSTVLGWSHYGSTAFEYLFGTKATVVYKVVFVGMVLVGSTMNLGLAWDLSDTFNGLMMIPNLIGVLALSGTVARITKNYVDRTFHGAKIQPMWSAFDEYQNAEEADEDLQKHA